jgi:dynein assembly factor 3
MRDTRLRAHFKERYDHRRNMCDWDYGMYLQKMAPLMNKNEYIHWRLKGIAYETRLASNTVPNRTFSSYVPGRDKKSKDSIMVRGFWGDIQQSPYIPFGVEIWKEPEKSSFGKKINF